MTIYEEYAKTKLQIELLTKKIQELSSSILTEIESLTEPMRTEHGMFTKVSTNVTLYTDKVEELKKEAIEKINEIKKVAMEPVKERMKFEEEHELVKVDKVISLRFTPKK